MPFTKIDKIVEAVFNTGVHGAEDPSIEFAVSVYVHPYHNGVFSVWIYVATLRKLA
jgi:coiled-coil and C2 domain-containing protein 2A